MIIELERQINELKYDITKINAAMVYWKQQTEIGNQTEDKYNAWKQRATIALITKQKQMIQLKAERKGVIQELMEKLEIYEQKFGKLFFKQDDNGRTVVCDDPSCEMDFGEDE